MSLYASIDGSTRIQDPVDILTSTAPNRYQIWGKNLDGSVVRGREFSYSDVHATLVLPYWYPSGDGVPPSVRLHGLTVFSLSRHRDKFPVVSMGRRGIKGMTKGHSTIAGSLGFVNYGNNPFSEAILAYNNWTNNLGGVSFTSVDELPPMDLSLVFHNEYQDVATILIKSLVIIDSSFNVSVQDINLTEAYSFMAADATNMIDVNRVAWKETDQRFNPSKTLGNGIPQHMKTLTPPTSGAVPKKVGRSTQQDTYGGEWEWIGD